MLHFALKIKNPGRMTFLMAYATVVVLMAVYGQTVLRPLIQHCARAKQELRSLNRRILLIHQWKAASRGNGPSGYRGTSPEPQSDLAEALLQLQNLGQDTGLNILSIHPKVVKKGRMGEPYRKTLIELNARGPEASLIAFLSGLRTCGFLCQISRLRINADRSEERMLSVQAILEKIDVLNISAEAPYFAASKQQNEETFAVKHTRRLFKSPRIVAPKIVHVSGADPAEAIKNLSLVGIIEDGERKAVIEDRKSAKTHILKQNDDMAGLVIKEIGEGVVVLEAAGTAFRLDL